MSVRDVASRVVGIVAAIGLADALVSAGFVAALTGTIRLFGLSVALVVFGGLAMLAGVALVVSEARR